jgi:membrane protease YdiL (CAAX protease family)
MAVVRDIFWNADEARPRAGWRLLIQFFLTLALILLLNAPFGALNLDDTAPIHPALPAAVSLVRLGITLLSVWLAGRFMDRRRFMDFGLHFSRSWWLDFGVGLALGAAQMSGVVLIGLLAGWMTVADTFVLTVEGLSFPVAILLWLISFIGVGIYEELFSRGYQLRNLAEGLKLKGVGHKGALALATLLSAVFFSLLHGEDVPGSLNIVVSGIVLALAVLLTGELALPTGYHIAWNFFAFNVFGFAGDGTAPSVAFMTFQPGAHTPAGWTGGALGPHALLADTLATLVSLALIVAWARLRYGKLRLREDLTTPDLLPRARDRGPDVIPPSSQL